MSAERNHCPECDARPWQKCEARYRTQAHPSVAVMDARASQEPPYDPDVYDDNRPYRDDIE